MKKFLVLAGTLLFTVTAYAGFRGFNGSTDLSIFNNLKCSTGLTCSKVGDKFVIVSSPTISTGSLSLTGAEAGDAVLSMIADEGDDNGDTWKMKSVAASDSLIFYNNVSGSDVAKFTMTTGGNVSMVGSLTGDGGDALSGFLNKQVAATATTITAAQCGSTFINSGAVQMELPEASTVLGCRLTFITGNASNFDVNPDDADQILVETNAAGDAMRNATLGNSITIEAISASQWAPVAVVGTWTDIN